MSVAPEASPLRIAPLRIAPLRIAVVNWQCRENPLAGGAEIHLHEIFGRLADKGHEVSLLCSGWKGAPPLARLPMIRRTFLFLRS